MVNSIKITDYITEDLIDLDLKSKNREGILVELSELLEKSPNITGEESDIYKALVDREKLGSTGIGKGVAIPHAKTESAKELTVAFGVSREGIDFNSLDEEDVHLFFVFASPNRDSHIYLKVLARISRLIREEEFRENLFNCKTPKEVIDCHKEGAEIYNSASMSLDEVIDVTVKAIKENKKVARVHTGDPAIYGAHREQMDMLDEYGIEYEVIPGVSSFLASAAALKKEFTLPNVSQTVICTRIEGRTSVPEKESLESLAKHRASMAIFLSVHMIDKVVETLATSYPMTTPVAVVQRASWPDQKIVLGTLETIEQKVKEAGINKTAQILVGDFLGNEYEKSKLYDKYFTHEYREAVKK